MNITADLRSYFEQAVRGLGLFAQFGGQINGQRFAGVETQFKV